MKVTDYLILPVADSLYTEDLETDGLEKGTRQHGRVHRIRISGRLEVVRNKSNRLRRHQTLRVVTLYTGILY